MHKWTHDCTVADLGEKTLIAELIRPFFDSGHENKMLGHDSAVLTVLPDHQIVLSTDRIPADLIAFKTGLIDCIGLGRYLATLNYSDIAATGADAVGLLLNLGLPSSMLVNDLAALLRGVREISDAVGARVVGGDITSSAELSISATSIGIVPSGLAFRRSGARVGDAVFASKPLGLTPTAFEYFCKVKRYQPLPELESTLARQFRDVFPELELARQLRNHNLCSACIDNTDGLAQSFAHISEESGVAIILEAEKLVLQPETNAIARISGIGPLDLAFGPGADFSLVGTLRSTELKNQALLASLGVTQIGFVECGHGVFLQTGDARDQITVRGWDYFVREQP